MNKKTIEIAIAAVLAVALLFFIGGSFKKMRAKNAAGSAVKRSVPGAIVKPLFTVKKEEKKEIAEKESSLLRDPFSFDDTSQVPPSGASDLKLTGIIMGDKKKPRAVINGNIVSVGGRIGGFELIKIEQNRAVVTDGKENFELKMN